MLTILDKMHSRSVRREAPNARSTALRGDGGLGLSAWRAGSAGYADVTVTSRFAAARPQHAPFQRILRRGLSYRGGQGIAMGYAAPAAVVALPRLDEQLESTTPTSLSSATKSGVSYVADGHYWTQQFIS